MRESLYSRVFFNGIFAKTQNFDESLVKKGKTIYEVVRVIDGICLFLEDHLNRFYQSLEITGLDCSFSEEYLKKTLYQLIDINKVKNGNLKFSLTSNEGQIILAAYFIQPRYPAEAEFINGVKTTIIQEERSIPNAKIRNDKLRDTSNKMIKEFGYYDIILENGDGLLTEGSRTNVFFIQKNTLYTAPKKLILEGVTRKHVLMAIQLLKLKTEEIAISAQQIEEMDAAFFTGTSPKVLPIASIGDKKLNTKNEILFRVKEKFDEVIEYYINTSGQIRR